MLKVLLLSVSLWITSAYGEPAEDKINDTTSSTEQAVVPEQAKHIHMMRGYKVEADDIFLGNANSKTIVIEYYSPTCVHCGMYHKMLFPEIEKKYIDTGKIAYVIREFIGYKQDFDAAILARCDGSIEKYKSFMSVLLEQQSSWAFSKNYHEILTNIGSLGGISPQKYATCLKDEKKMQTLLENTKLLGSDPNFRGTPAFFINGQAYTNPYTIEGLSEAIDKAINEQQKAPDNPK